MGTLQTRRVLVIIFEIQLSFAKIQRCEKEKQLTFTHTCMLEDKFLLAGFKPENIVLHQGHVVRKTISANPR